MKRTRPAAATLAVSAVAYAVTVFLLLPTILIVPMSFGPDQYLRFPPDGFTLRWYEAYFKDADWIGATLFSVKIAVLTALAATLIGTLVSVALVRGRLPLKRVFELLVVGPVIVPNIALAIAMFLVFDRLRLTGTTLRLRGGAHRPCHALRRLHDPGLALSLRLQPRAGGAVVRRQSPAGLRPGHPAADRAGHRLGGLVRLHHLVRRAGGVVLHLEPRQPLAAAQDVRGHRLQHIANACRGCHYADRADACWRWSWDIS